MHAPVPFPSSSQHSPFYAPQTLRAGRGRAWRAMKPGVSCGSGDEVVAVNVSSSPGLTLVGTLPAAAAALQSLRVSALPSHALSRPRSGPCTTSTCLTSPATAFRGEIPVALAHYALGAAVPSLASNRFGDAIADEIGGVWCRNLQFPDLFWNATKGQEGCAERRWEEQI